MNYNYITQLLDNGLESEEVLAFLMKNAPMLQKKIRSLLVGGWGPSEILSYLNKDKATSKVNLKNSNPVSPEEVANLKSYKASRDITQSRDEQALSDLRKFTRGAIQTGTTLASLYGGGKALQAALPIASQAFNPLINSMMGTMGNAPPTGEMQQVPGMPTQAEPNLIAQQPISPELTQPTIQESNPQSVSLIDQMQYGNIVKQLADKESPETIAQALNTLITPAQKKWLKQQTKDPLEKLVSDYIQLSKQKPAEQDTQEAANTILPEEAKPIEEPKVAQSKLAALPNGQIGQIEDVRQGIATVDVNGKKRRIKATDLEKEPEELEPVVRSLIEAIPEDQRSAVLAFASYNPGTEFEYEGKKFNIPFMATQFHNGDFYLYPGVTKDQFDKVVSKAVKAKTTGENAWHAWTSGEESRGAGMHQLIKELESQLGKNFIKFKASDGYDIFKIIREIVKKISRERKT